MKLTNKQKRKIFGRWLENLGLGITAGGIVAFVMTNWKFWYFILAGALLIYLGAEMQLKKK